MNFVSYKKVTKIVYFKFYGQNWNVFSFKIYKEKGCKFM